MELDLFLPKKELLKRWMRDKKVFTGAEIEAWGVNNYYICARRRAREFAEKEYIRPLNDREKEQRAYKGKCEIYKWIDNIPEYSMTYQPELL